MPPVGSKTAGKESKQKVKKTVEKVSIIKKKNDKGEELDEEEEERYQEDIEVDAEGEQPEEKEALVGSMQLEIAAQSDHSKIEPVNLEKRIKDEEEDTEMKRRKAVQERRKDMTDEEILKEEGWKKRDVWDKETLVTAIYMARAGAQGISNFIQKNLQRVMDEWKEQPASSNETTKTKRSWTTKKNMVPTSYNTPKRITQTGEIVNTAKKTQEGEKIFKEMEDKMKAEIEKLTERLQRTDLGEDDSMTRLKLQEAKMEKTESMMKQQQKINEMMNNQVRYLMKHEIAEDRKKAERQVVVRGWVKEMEKEIREQWVINTLGEAGFNTNKWDYNSEVTDIQHESYKGFSNMSIISFREPWMAKKLIDWAKTETLQCWIPNKNHGRATSSWDSGNQWQGSGWAQQTWSSNQWQDNRNQGRFIKLKMGPQLAKFDRTQQYFLRCVANAYNLAYNKHVELNIDWKGFSIWAKEDGVGAGADTQLAQLTFTKDGEVGIYTEQTMNDYIAELFFPAMNIAAGHCKFTWEREWPENRWEKDRNGNWQDKSEIGQILKGRKPTELSDAERKAFVDATWTVYPGMRSSERSQYPWRPYFCTVPSEKFFESIRIEGDQTDWAQEGKQEWENWRWRQQGSQFTTELGWNKGS